MTQIIEETDLDWLTLIDYEAEVPCESTLNCSQTAVWKCRTACCGTVFLMCDKCVIDLEKFLDAIPGATCMACGRTTYDPKNFVIRPHVRL
jgi:hypothetical protein